LCTALAAVGLDDVWLTRDKHLAWVILHDGPADVQGTLAIGLYVMRDKYDAVQVVVHRGLWQFPGADGALVVPSTADGDAKRDALLGVIEELGFSIVTLSDPADETFLFIDAIKTVEAQP
jgi:hypothetical protein